jgi:putative tricarboxylic transport membrane protein
MVLGDGLERALRQSLMMSEGHLSVLVTRPLSATMICLALAILIMPLVNKVRSFRLKAMEQDD